MNRTVREVLPAQADVVVVGSGPAGAVAALTLARAGVKVVVIDAGHSTTQVGETLPPAVRPVLDRLGMRAPLAAEGHLPSVGNWSAWGGAEPWGHDHLFNVHGHGWHIDRRRFDAWLRGAARAAGAHLATGVAVTASERIEGGGFRLRLGNGAGIVAALVLDASGRAGVFARQRGVRRRALDRMVALVGYVVRRADAAEEPAATLVEAAADGWWYSAPLPQARLATVFMTDADLVRGMGFAADGWLARLSAAEHTAARALRYGAGLAAPPTVVAASSSRLERFGDVDWLAIGDAAATQDPLSSEGILVAIETGLDGAAAAEQALRGHRDALLAAAETRETRWREYREQFTRYYTMERRWPDAPFWQRRRDRGSRLADQSHRSVA